MGDLNRSAPEKGKGASLDKQGRRRDAPERAGGLEGANRMFAIGSQIPPAEGMMKTLHFDCYAGISGDMTLGALVDLGADPAVLKSELKKLGVGGWKLEFLDDERGGIHGLHAAVDLGGGTSHLAEEHDNQDSRFHKHNPEQVHDELIYLNGRGAHQHNSWKDIRSLIEKSGIRPGAKKRALAIFTRIAEAEAQVHGVAIEDVAFHEVGALDSIIDVVGSAICIDLLNPDRITCGPVELGGGTVKCAHGILPVPAPATLKLVKGIPVTQGGFNKEMTTPTGAAIIGAMVDEFITGSVSFTEIKTGYGIGTRRMERPNLLRVSWRETSADPAAAAQVPWKTETLTLIETNIDDMSAEALGFLMERLFDAGALDVTFTPCVMKKSRPGTVVSVLGNQAKLNDLRECLFRNSTTIGFRETEVNRLSLERKEQILTGSFGEAREKTVSFGGKELRSKIEFEDRARIAREKGISLDEAEKILRGQ